MIFFIEFLKVSLKIIYQNINIMSYIIIKLIKNQSTGKDLPVVLLNGEEVWSFETVEEALKIAEILTINSDSGYRYYVKKT